MGAVQGNNYGMAGADHAARSSPAAGSVQANGVQAKTNQLSGPILSSAPARGADVCAFHASRQSSVGQLFSSAVRHDAHAGGGSVHDNHAVAPPVVMSREQIARVAERLMEIEAEIAKHSILIQSSDGSFAVRAWKLSGEHIDHDDFAQSAAHYVRVDRTPIDGYDGVIHVHKDNKHAAETSLFAEGMNLKVVVDVSDEEVHKACHLIREYKELTHLMASAKVKDVAVDRGLHDGSCVGLKGVPQNREMTVVVVPSKDARAIFAAKMTEAFLLEAQRKKERNEERQAQEADDARARIDREVVREGVRKQEIVGEGVKFNERRL